MAMQTSIILRIDMDKAVVSFGDVASVISGAGGDIIAIDVIRAGQESTTRDITVDVAEAQYEQVVTAVEMLQGIKLIHVSDRTFLMHLGGKIEIQGKMPIKNRDDLSRVYTPGVARVCMAIHEQPQKAYSLTIKRNSVAIITDGTAVLGLGDIGPHAAMPVMEGKAMLFKQLADVDAYPICLDTKDTNEIIQIIKAISPGFGGINLEDISSPRCFQIEEQLTRELNIPVFHDDQHGTAVVIMAGLINALKIVSKPMDQIRIVVAGIGAAGVSCCKMLLAAGVKDLVAVDREGAIRSDRTYDNPMWNWLADRTNPQGLSGKLSEVIKGADVFIGVSGPGVLKAEDIISMAADPIVFAMANPEPEINPEDAEPYTRILATGRSDYPNQINNVLCFPGLFRGVLDCQASVINEDMKLAAAKAIAAVVLDDEVNEHYIIPSIFNDKVVDHVRHAIIETAIRTGVARRVPPEFR